MAATVGPALPPRLTLSTSAVKGNVFTHSSADTESSAVSFDKSGTVSEGATIPVLCDNGRQHAQQQRS